jgi:hypothetical protein
MPSVPSASDGARHEDPRTPPLPEPWSLLRDRRVTPELLGSIARDPRWKASYEIKRALALHPRTPLGLARDLLSQLCWRELSEIVNDVRIGPQLRRQAEQALSARAAQLTLGERTALARRASRRVIASLVPCRDGAVLQGLLANPRATELDACRIASAAETPAETLSRLAGHPRWGSRRDVRLALVDNPRTPFSVALNLLAGLAPTDLQRIAGDPKVRRLVRITAHRRLAPRIG